LISHHETVNQTRGKRLDTRGSCLTFTGLTTPLVLCTIYRQFAFTNSLGLLVNGAL